MKDVTSRLNSYRECVRHLWNAEFLGLVAASPDKWALREAFDNISSALFDALVVEPLRLAPASQALRVLNRASAPLSWLSVVPSSPAGVPIMINRDSSSDHGYWDHPPDRVLATDVGLRFVRWFDFDELAFRDFRHYLVRIVSSTHADLVGRAALIECEYVNVLLDEGAFRNPSVA
jgi:hypothetical protein